MADNRRVRRTLKDLQRIKTWQLLILLILAGFISATFLRLNNIGMVERRSAVITADQSGNQEDIVRRLYDLQQYVSSHMNTDLGKGVYLEASYKRDYQKAIEAGSADQNPNGSINKKADEVCKPRFSGYSNAYLQCFLGELAKYPAAADPVSSLKLPPPEGYVHSFVSPLWSPDFAGWSVVVCLILILMIVARLIGLGILKLLLRRHYKSV